MTTDRSSSISTELADRAVLALGFVTLAVLSIRTIASHDLWWQLAAGRWILENGFPSTDPFSYWASGRPWIELRWLWCVVARFLFDAAGPAALTLAVAALLAVAAWLVARRGAGWAASAGLLYLLLLAHTRFVVRPEIVTYLALVLESFAILDRWRAARDARWLFVLPGLQIVWVNSHTLSVLGPVVAWTFVGATAIESTLLRGWFGDAGGASPERRALPPSALRAPLLAAAAMSLACLVNPWGLAGAMFPLTLFSEIGSGHTLKASILEFRSPWTLGWSNPFCIVWIVGLVLGAAALAANRRRTQASDWALFACFAYLSSLAIRNVALLGFAGGYLVAKNLGDLSRRRAGGSVAWLAWPVRATAAVAFLVAISVVASGRYYDRTEPGTSPGLGVAHIFPVKALAFARENQLPFPVIHALGDGGYVLFEGGARSVLVDGRLEVYGGELIERSAPIWSKAEGIDALGERFGAHVALVRHAKEAGFLGALLRRPDWVPVYYDPTHVLFVHRTDATKALVDRLAIDWKSDSRPRPATLPSWYSGASSYDAIEEAALGKLHLVTGNLAAARGSFERSLALAPGGEDANLHLGLLLRAEGNEAEAARRFEHVRPQLFERPDVIRLEASVLEQSGRADLATDAFLRLAAAGEASAWGHVGRVALAAGRTADARRAFEEVARREPSGESFRNLGVLLDRLGETDAALASFERSVAIQPGQPAVWNRIGTIRITRGEIDRGREALRRALSIDPSYAPAKVNLETIGG